MMWDKFVENSDRLFRNLICDGQEYLPEEPLQHLAEKFREPGYVDERLRNQERFDYRPAFKLIVAGHRRMMMRHMARIAAVIFLPLAIGGMAYFLWPGDAGVPPAEELAAIEVKPGYMRAVLKMADGREVELSGQKGELCESNGTAIRIDSLGIRYVGQGAARRELMNSVSVPRGGEYFLVLSDGTEVWLNADSELKYPVNFSSSKREVIVTGEAYFEVSRDTSRPFIVRTEAGSVRVLGTKFNVQAYRGEECLVATLVEGAVSCSLPGGTEAVVLYPDEQVTIGQGKIGPVRKVKTLLYTGWKDGLFIFESERLEDILIRLSRWYDVDVFYTDPRLKELHFSGDLSRFKNIDVFFRMFENSADIVFNLKGKALTVSRR